MLTNSSAQRVLCFGDSNTYGLPPDSRERFSVNQRWPALLQKELGDSFDIIEEGLPGRTVDVENPYRLGRNGKTYLAPCLESHNPLDIVVVMLGTNDCKAEFVRTAEQIAAALSGLVADIKQYGSNSKGQAPHVLLVSPVPLADFVVADPKFNKASVEASHTLAAAIGKLAQQTQCQFFDAGTVAGVGQDGIHITREGHAALSKALTSRIKEVA